MPLLSVRCSRPRVLSVCADGLTVNFVTLRFPRVATNVRWRTCPLSPRASQLRLAAGLSHFALAGAAGRVERWSGFFTADPTLAVLLEDRKPPRHGNPRYVFAGGCSLADISILRLVAKCLVCFPD